MNGVDYAFYPHPSVTALKAAGVKFVGRYVSPQAANDANGKNLIPAEFKALHDAGMAIILYEEQYAARMREGYPAGVADAKHFDAVVKALGMTGAIMYAAADWDATEAEQEAINRYLDGVASVIGRARTGIYGGYYVVKRALDARKATHAVQTVAWSGGQWDSRADVRQYLSVKIDGAVCDRLESMKADYGQWPRPAPAPVAKLTVTPVSGLAPLAVTASYAGSSPGGRISIDWGDGSNPGTATAHTYTAPGRYTVKLTVTIGSASSSATVAVTVQADAYRHVVPAGYELSIGALAESRGTTVAHLTSVSHDHLSPAELAAFDAYLALNLAMIAASMPSPAMPEGLVYYTTNP